MTNRNLQFEDSINIFTDASLTKIDNEPIISSGYALVKDGIIERSDFSVFCNATNNYGELFAIYMGIKAAIDYKNIAKRINLFSDSRISVYSLREWIFKWRVVNNDFISGSGKRAENQDVIHMIIDSISMNNLPINIYCQRGHKNSDSNANVVQQRDYFYQENGIYLPLETASKICYYNDFVDTMTRNNLLKLVNEKNFDTGKYNKKIFPLAMKIDNTFMGNYYRLINGGTYSKPKSYFE